MVKKVVLELERSVKGTKITLRKEVEDSEDMAAAINTLTDELTKAAGLPEIENSASLEAPPSIPREMTPTPQFDTGISQLPNLVNPPHSYSASKAVLEVLDPTRSKWAQEPLSVAEIQKRLMDLGVRGISTIENFDSSVRTLMRQGKIRREKIKGKYKYFV